MLENFKRAYMRFLILAAIAFATLRSEACSVQLTTESLLPLFDGSACVQISAVIDGKRKVVIDSYSSTGELTHQKNFTFTTGKDVYVLASYDMPYVGELKLVEMRVKSLNRVNLKFLNGNSMDLAINANGQASPSHLCISQEGAMVLKGYANRCPRN